jgi:hypothetical protein
VGAGSILDSFDRLKNATGDYKEIARALTKLESGISRVVHKDKHRKSLEALGIVSVKFYTPCVSTD